MACRPLDAAAKAAPNSGKDYGLKKGAADLKSVGPIAFGPPGITTMVLRPSP